VILGSGVDLCEVPRIEAAVARYGSRFLERIYTAREIAYADRKANRFERYAARFAAKEAGMTSAPTGLGPQFWTWWVGPPLFGSRVSNAKRPMSSSGQKRSGSIRAGRSKIAPLLV
jgi:hypothetical protein